MAAVGNYEPERAPEKEKSWGTTPHVKSDSIAHDTKIIHSLLKSLFEPSRIKYTFSDYVVSMVATNKAFNLDDIINECLLKTFPSPSIRDSMWILLGEVSEYGGPHKWWKDRDKSANYFVTFEHFLMVLRASCSVFGINYEPGMILDDVATVLPLQASPPPVPAPPPPASHHHHPRPTPPSTPTDTRTIYHPRHIPSLVLPPPQLFLYNNP